MSTTTIDRTKYNLLVDDDGSGNTGSVWSKTNVKDVLDAVDLIFSANTGLSFGGPCTERGRSAAMGAWTHVAFSSGNFSTDTGGVTWTQPNDSNYVAYDYALVGDTMHWIVSVLSGTISGACGYLTLAVPGGFMSALNWTTAAQIYDGSGYNVGLIYAAQNASVIRVYKTFGFGGWTAQSGTAAVRFSASFKVA